MPTERKPNSDHERSPWRKTKPTMMAAGSSGRLKEKTNLSDCWGVTVPEGERTSWPRTEGNQGTAAERISFQQAVAELQEEETDSQQHAVETLTEGGQEKQKAQLRTAELAGGVPLLGGLKETTARCSS